MQFPTPPDQAMRDRATDPTISCVVQAPAGAGKTTLLAHRYLALLEIVNQPDEILAITFTIKAAAEMRNRVLELLRSKTPLAQRVRERARRLDWRIEENPNALKIQTIDSFALEIARRAPGKQNLSGFDIVTEPQALFRAATEALLVRLLNADSTAPVIAEFLAFLDNDPEKFISLISTMLAGRDQWLGLAQSVSQTQDRRQLSELLSKTTSVLRSQAEGELNQKLDADDHRWFSELSSSPWPEIVPTLMTKQNTLRKMLTKELVPDSDRRREAKLWLASLNERGMATDLETFALLPDPNHIEDEGSRLKTCCINLALAAVELEQQFQQHSTIDFTGLLIAAKHALADADGAVTDLAQILDYRLNHLLIDEFQDTSRAQIELFEMLVESWQMDDGKSFFAVGDPMQSIYGFRDADVAIFSEVVQRGVASIPLSLCQLSANFRSDPALVDWTNKLFNAYSEDRELNAVAMRDSIESAQVQCHHFPDDKQEIAACIAHIEALLAADESRSANMDTSAEACSSIALLCRSRKHIVPILQGLRARSIEWQATDMDALKDSPVVMDLLSAVAVLLTPQEKLGWFALLRSPMFGIPLADLLEFAGGEFPDTLSSSTQDYAQRLTQAYAWAQHNLYEISFTEVVEGFWLRCGGADAYPLQETADALAFFELLESLPVEQLDVPSIQLAVEQLFATSSQARRVQVLTMHKAKGLEFDHVIVPRLDAGTRTDRANLLLWQATHAGLLMGLQGDQTHNWLKAQQRAREQAEDPRLLYVACTRASISLYLSYTCAADAKPRGLAKYLAEVATPGPAHEAGDHLQSELFSTTTLMRLPQDYQWLAADPSPLPTTALTAGFADAIAERTEVEVGNLVHRVLAYLSRLDATSMSADQIQRICELWSPVDDSQVAVIATRQVTRLLATEVGQWVLAHHPQQESESAYQMVDAGEVVSIVIDRMFIFEGERWIVDYKTSQLGSPADLRVRTLSERYRPQLNQYVEVMRHAYPEPIRTALLFTDICHLEILQ